MGYYVETVGCNFRLPKDKFEIAYEAMCDLNDHDELKMGGKYPADEDWKERYNPNKWFSWMPYNYPETTNGLIDIIELLGFENLKYNHNGDLVYLSYYNKTGSEALFFGSIAKFVDEGSTIDWRGEDGEYWRWYFSNGSIDFKYGSVVFE